MSNLLSPIAPSIGLEFKPSDAWFIATEAIYAGQVAEVDQSLSDSGSVSNAPGTTASGLARLVSPTATGSLGGRTIVVSLTSAAAGGRIRARISGIALVYIYGTFTKGQLIILNAGTAGAGGKRVFGKILSTGGEALLYTAALVLFNGDGGLSQIVTDSGSEPSDPGPPTWEGDAGPPLVPNPAKSISTLPFGGTVQPY